ncbi:MAG: arginyl-tRNA synthetase [Microgenomates group bacterium Gr01-1014_93]|nr:MAG: arginyl-tRNA synthetase [Microgenomates group bacterium Gr01-1014_93]
MTKNLYEKIYSILSLLASNLGVKEAAFLIETPKEKSHGDLSSNIALVLAKNLKKPPMEIANLLSESLQKESDLRQYFDKVEAIEPGFINFYFSKQYLASQISEIINLGSSYGSLDIGKDKKVSVEFVSANPTGPLHIGNARGGPLGDTIANVMSKAGYKVTREYLHNNVGGQVDRLGEAIYFKIHPDQKPENYEVQYQGEYITELAKMVEEQMDKHDDLSQGEFIQKAGAIAVEIMLEEILKDCEQMGIKFDKIRKESDLRKEVDKVLPKIKKYLKDNEGALWFAPNDEFLKDRETVIQKSNGEYTYFASDIAYHNEKMSQNDIVIDILGANHSGHVPRLQAVVKSLGFDLSNFKTILYQWIRLKRGGEIVKMSKRAGTFVTAKEVLDEVGKDAFRFFLLVPRSQTHMDFDLELAKKKAQDNPVFYIQYAYSRICSVFKKTDLDFKDGDLNLLLEKEEIDLIRNLILFPDLVGKASQTLEVNAFCNYALETANLFHKFYESQRVLSDNNALTKARLSLLKATQITLENTLDILGVSAPEKM